MLGEPVIGDVGEGINFLSHQGCVLSKKILDSFPVEQSRSERIVKKHDCLFRSKEVKLTRTDHPELRASSASLKLRNVTRKLDDN
jgi:hypothetical protein